VAAVGTAALLSVGVMAVAAAQPGDPRPADDPTVAFEDSNTEEEFQLTQNSDGPAPTRAQFALGQAITERLLTPDWNAPDPDGVPPELFKGVIGVHGAQAEGYTLVVGRGTSIDEVKAGLLKSLPSESADSLTVVESEASAEEFTAAWRGVRANQDLGLATLGINAELQKIIVGVHPYITDADKERLRGLSPLLAVEVVQVGRAVGLAADQ
jgi:hypothetical protein